MALTHFSAPKVAVVSVVTSSVSWGLGKEQGCCELLRWMINIRAVNLNLLCLLISEIILTSHICCLALGF